MLSCISTLAFIRWCWSWNSNTLATWCEELTPWKRPWFWERLKAGGEADNRGWDGWMASLTWYTWVWVSSGSWWWTGRPAWCAVVHAVAKSRTQLSDWTELYVLNTWGCELTKGKGTLCQVCIPSHKPSASLAHSRLTLNVCWMNLDIYDILKGSENRSHHVVKFSANMSVSSILYKEGRVAPWKEDFLA